MANIFRGPTHASTLKRAFIGSDVIPNILLGLAALVTPLNQPFSQHDWPNPVRARIAPQDFQCAGYTTRGIPPPPPFYQTDQPNPTPRAKANPQDFQVAGYTTRNIPPPPPFYQTDQPNPVPRERDAPQDYVFAGGTTRGISAPWPFNQYDQPNPTPRARVTPQAFEWVGATTRGIPAPWPFNQYDQPNPQPRARALLQDHCWAGSTTRNIPPPPPFFQTDQPNPSRARITPQGDSYDGMVTRGIPPPPANPPFVQSDWPITFRARSSQGFEWSGVTTRNIPGAPPFRQNDQPNPSPRAKAFPQDFQWGGYTTRGITGAAAPFTSSEYTVGTHQAAIADQVSGGQVYSFPAPGPNLPIVSHEYQVGTHQLAIADQHSRGQVYGQPPPSNPTFLSVNSGMAAPETLDVAIAAQHCGGSLWGNPLLPTAASPPFGLIFQGIETRDRSDPNASWIDSPFPSVLVIPKPALGSTWVASPEPIRAIDAVQANASGVWGPTPPSGPQKSGQLAYAAPQHTDLASGYARVYGPVPPGGGQTVQYEWYADQDWPEYRASFVETGYTALFVRLPAPVAQPTFQGRQLDTEHLQPVTVKTWGPQPPTAVQVPLGPLPQAAPQQTDQGYGLVDTLGWSRFPPISIAPDKVPISSIPQAAPEQLDYLRSNQSEVAGPQPSTGLKAPINRTGWTDPDQKTVASQQSYGALFGARKPPSYFINVKMVPGEDNPEQPSGSAGHGRLWALAPPTAQPFLVNFEIQGGTHQRNIADAHSKGWVVPRLPPSSTAVPLGPMDFAAPEQFDLGRAFVTRQPPPSAQTPPLTPFVYGHRVENFENDTLVSAEPLVATPPATPLKPIFFAAPQFYEQAAPSISSPQLGGQGPLALVVSTIFGDATDRVVDLASGQAWGPRPGTATRPLGRAIFAAQDVPEQPAPSIYATQSFPTRFLSVFTSASQEVQDSGYAQVAQSGLLGTTVLTFPAQGQDILVMQESVPDYGGAWLSKPLLPLPTPALGPGIFSAPEHRDLGDIAGGIGSVFSRIPPTGGNPPITISLFSAPDQRNQADEPSGGQVKVVWQRKVPTNLTAPHMLPLGFGMIRLGGIQMN